MSRTSLGEEICVSFEIVEPPDTSFLIAGLPRTSTTPPAIIAAHRDVVLFAVTSSCENTYPTERVVDFFVYQASRLPSLFLLPSAGGSLTFHTEGLGIMSCTSNDDSSPPFVVAYLQITPVPAATIAAHLFRSGSGQWEVFKNLHFHGANESHESLLRWWRTDEVVRYGRRYFIWVDYYRGMVVMDLSLQLSERTTNPPQRPRLRYVQLPVDRVGDPEEMDMASGGFSGRGCPKASRSVCVTRYGIKFVSVDRQQWSNFGIGNHYTRTWSHRFRITTWSLCEDDYTWRNDVAMHEEKFWDTFDGGDRFPFPHVQPQFPVVDVDNPDVVVFQLEKPVAANRSKWMIEVDLRNKLLLAATDYSKMERDYAPIPSELPRYLDGGQACKKRKQ